MKSHRIRVRTAAPLAAGLSAALALSALIAAPASAAPAEGSPTTVTDAVFHWGLSNESGNRAFAPGTYNFLSAGIAPKTGGSDTIAEGEWAATSGNVTIEKLQADGSHATATWAGLKTDPAGDPITSPTSGRYSANRVAITAGTGTLDADADTADISWDGDFTVAFYSGMTQFSVTDPHLVVTGGEGTLTATLNGFGTSMEDPTVFTTLPAQEVTLADFTGIDVTATGIEATPAYEGVTVDLPDTASPQVTSGDHWGSFPQSFIDYQLLTGQSSYWYSSGLSTDAAKAALPVSISIGGGSEPGTGEPGTGEPGTGEPQPGDGDGDAPIEHATVEFGFNEVHQGASPAGGCNYFVAGKVQGLGSDYTSIDGNVYIVKKHEDGSSEVVSVGTRCTAADADSSTINQRYLFTEGTGQTAADGSTTIQWTGAGTTNAYGGLVSWYFENPKLVLDASGDGSITANVGGFGSSMEDPTVKVPLDPREGVEIATVRGATIEDGTLTIDPVWKNVDYFPLANPQDPSSARSTTSAIPQAAKDANPDWGSWPESFVDFQYATGLSSYWHTSGLTADPLKPPMPIDVAFEGSAPDYGVLFTTEPTSAVLSEGDDVTFHAAATGQTGTPTLQWQVKRAGGEWADLEGSTGGELALPDVSVADWNGASVRAVATLGDRTAVSVVATISVTASAAPVFTTQPTDMEALVDQSAYFQVEVTGYPTPTYQWQRQLPGGEWEDVAGGTYAWYNYYPITLADDGAAIRVIATNASGSVSSDVVHLTVSTLPVTIQAQPKSLSVFEGGSGWLAAWVDGAPYPTFQWERSLDGAAWEAVEGANDSVLDFGVVTADEAQYQYRLTATNGLASVVTDSATVTILPPADPPVWVSPTTDLDPAVDNTLAVSLGQLPALPAGSTGLFHIGLIEKSVWQPGDSAVAFDEFVPFAVGNFAPGDLSFLRTEVWVQAGSLDPSKEYGVAMMFEPSGSTPALPQFDIYVPVTVAQPAVPTVTVSKTSGLDPNGETITVTGSGFLPHSPDTDGARPPLAGTFAGAYVVFGKFADTWRPSAGAPSSARTALDTKWGVHASDVATIGGADRGAIEIGPDGTFSTTLTVKSGAFDKEGTYGVYTYAGGGAVHAPFETATPVTLNEAAAAVTTQPSSVVAPEGGEPASFTVGVSGAPAPAVQWERQAADGSWAALEGATSATLTLPYTTADDGASVRAVVTNGLGSSASDAATLVVSPSATPEPLTNEELMDDARGTVSIVSVDGRTVVLSLGARSGEFAGRFVGAEVHSAPVFLGWRQVAAAGTVSVTLPADLPAGTHKLALRDASGTLLGWAAVTVAATPGDPVTPVTPVDPAPGASGTGTGAGSGSAALSNTGFEVAGWLAGALLLLLAGAGALLTRRARRG